MSCLICLQLDNNLIGLHSRENADHHVCPECFTIWYIKNKHQYNCIMCKEAINMDELPLNIKKSIKLNENEKPRQYRRRRSFKIINNNISRFYGKTPKEAASKAFTSLIKNIDQNELNFSIIECTQNSKKKIYKYDGKRIKLENPILRKIGNKEFHYNFKNLILKSS